MSGEGYTGHVNGDSAPYQFKIPAATADQYGVVKLGTFRDGINAFTTTTAAFTQPAIGASVTAEVANSSFIAPGQVLYVASGGYYLAQATPDSTHVQLLNLGYSGNTTPGLPVSSNKEVSPGGLEGPEGPAGTGTAELAFGQLFTIAASGPIGGTEKYFDINGVITGGSPNNVLGGLRINASRTYDTFGATMASLIIGGVEVTVTLYASTDNGQTYNSVASVLLTTGTQEAQTSFGPTVFPAKTLFCVGAITDGPNVAGGLSATVSKS